MLNRLLRALGWVTKAEREGAKIDVRNALMFKEIRDKACLLSAIIDFVPDGSIWSIEGGFGSEHEILASFEARDEVKTMKATIWPRQQSIKVLLNAESKPVIKSWIQKWDLNSSFVHQHIHYSGRFYLTAFDNLDRMCTYVSPDVAAEVIEKLVADGCVQVARAK